MISRSGWAATTVATSLLLAACSGSGGETGGSSAPTSTTSGAVESPSPQPSTADDSPVPPAEAATFDAAGAMAYTQWLLSIAIPTAQQTGNSTLIREQAIRGCTFCANIADTIDRAYVDGGRIEGGEIVVINVAASEADPDVGVEVTAYIDQKAARSVDRSGKVVETFAATPEQRLDVFVKREQSSWKIFDVSTDGGPSRPSSDAP